MPLISFAPNLCAVIMVRPPVKPKAINKSMKNIGAEAPNAAKALIPRRRPTMRMSEM